MFLLSLHAAKATVREYFSGGLGYSILEFMQPDLVYSIPEDIHAVYLASFCLIRCHEQSGSLRQCIVTVFLKN